MIQLVELDPEEVVDGELGAAAGADGAAGVELSDLVSDFDSDLDSGFASDELGSELDSDDALLLGA
jgi:hypothetical protein